MKKTDFYLLTSAIVRILANILYNDLEKSIKHMIILLAVGDGWSIIFHFNDQINLLL